MGFSTTGFVDRVLAGHVPVLGLEWSPKDGWRRDPLTGDDWPASASYRVDYRHAAVMDAKWNWEVNRLVHLVPLVQAVRAGYRAEESRATIEEHVADWLSSNSAGVGLPWTSAIEVSVRLIVLALIDETLEFDGELGPRIEHAIQLHAWWLQRFPSRHSSANNHRVAELAGLLVAHRCGHDVEISAKRVEYTSELSTLLSELILSDGMGAEQSPTYTAFTLELAAIALAFAPADGCKSSIAEKIANGGKTLLEWRDRNGRPVYFGDNDEARVLTVNSTENEYFAAIARLCDVEVVAPSNGLHVFAASGRTLHRGLHDSLETIVTLDHGPLGFGSIAAHGQADALSMSMRIGGYDIIVDPGTYRYHGATDWRRYFRSTRAHSTIQVDDLESSVPVGDFNWDQRLREMPVLEYASGDGSAFCLRASHDGFARQGGPTATRSLEGDPIWGYHVDDRVEGPCGQWSSGFVIHPAISVAPTAQGWVLAHPELHVSMSVVIEGADELMTITPSQQLIWHSPRYGEKTATHRLVWMLRGAGSMRATIQFDSPGQP